MDIDDRIEQHLAIAERTPFSFEIVNQNGFRSDSGLLANSKAQALQIYGKLKKPGEVVIITDKKGTRYRVDLGKLHPNP